ncbi:MAG: DUF6282 family protein [Legionellales bacterium]
MQSLKHHQFIDIHYHANPDLYIRRLSAIEAGLCYKSLGGAVFLKSHLGATCVQATLAQQQGLPVLPSLVLNFVAGGIDYRIIQRELLAYQPQIAAKMIVHFPTLTGRQFKSRLTRQLSPTQHQDFSLKPETLFNDAHQLKQSVIDILKMAQDCPIVLSTGHASKAEIYALIDACIQHHVPALLLNQPAHPLAGLKAQELKDLSKNDFIWIEQTALTYLIGHQTHDDFAAVLSAVPRVIYSSDLGQTNQMSITNWRQFSALLFEKLALSPTRQAELYHGNALALLGIANP